MSAYVLLSFYLFFSNIFMIVCYLLTRLSERDAFSMLARNSGIAFFTICSQTMSLRPILNFLDSVNALI